MDIKVFLTEQQQREIDNFSDIPDEQKIQYNRLLNTEQLLYYFNTFNEFINSGCTKSFILHDFELLKDEIKRRLNVYDKINDRFDKTNNDSVILIRDHWKKINK